MPNRKFSQWEADAKYGSDILGNGACQGDLTGKVKTRQIGFVRSEREIKPHRKPGNKTTDVRKK